MDTSCKGRKFMTGWGVDGTLYTFEVVQRQPIPMIISSSDGSYHDKKSDDKLPKPSTITFLAIHIHFNVA
jgi:hypothetical protein